MHPSFREAFRYWVKLGFINFGGPTGQIAIMHRDLVERKRWISEERFLHALNYCMLLPGPEATQLAIYVGWLLHRTIGGLVAGAFFVLPSVVVLLALSWVYAAYGTVPAIAGLFFGLKPVVLAVVAYAMIRIGRRALKTWVAVAIAASAFVAIYGFAAPFPLIVLGAGLVGFALYRLAPRALAPVASHAPAASDRRAVLGDADATPPHALPNRARAVRIVALGAALWLLPLAALFFADGWARSTSSRFAGPADVFWNDGLFFSKAALLTFGGAYAVLAYIAQAAVHQYHWLAPGQMIDGLGLAETTPGPLIMVTAFIGFMAGWNLHGVLAPALAGTLGLLLATYFTFLPSFLFIFLGAPYIEALRGKAALTAALSAITAAVVGVILNLAVFFGTNVIFPAGVFAWFPALLAVAAFVVLLAFDLDIIPVILAGAIIGLVARLAFGLS
ncbi:MAG: chromate efflux transporter [Thermoplasmatota archaeon]